MKNSIKQILILAAVFSAVSFHSCDFLNVSDDFDETLKYDSVFHNKRNIERYLWATAAYFPDEGTILTYPHTPGPFATDEAFSMDEVYYGMNYVLGKVTATNGGNMNNWSTFYVIIRKANTILARMDEAGLTALEKRELLGYTYFMRAYAYYNLAIKFGPVVLLGDDVLENNEDAAYYDRVRATYDETIDYTCTELEKAAEYLDKEVPVSYFGRPTRGAALALVARLRLIQASPLYNGQTAAHTYFGGWTRSVDGQHYISQKYDEKKWATAALAAKRVIDMGLYELHTVDRMPDTRPLPATVPAEHFPDGAGGIDPFRSYSDMFTGETLAARNKEFIWARASAGIERACLSAFPVLPMGGWNSLQVTQKVVNAYRMEDGTDKPYVHTAFKGGSNEVFSGYRLNSSVSDMYVGREMRFYASIGFCECYWPANSTSDNTKKGQTVTYYLDGTAGKQQTDGNINNYPNTGYVLKKFVHPDDAFAGANAQRVAKSFPIIRYAEIILSYAEALNNLTGSHTLTDADGTSHTFYRNEEEIKKYFNMVRFRAGLPGITSSELSSAATVQSLIERERMVEFVHEDRRYFDVRRWGIYEITEKEPIEGMNTDAVKSEYYHIVPVNHSKARSRVVDKRLVLFPIALEEIRKAPSLDQNPGYQK
jgi:hypothetical protein